MPTSPPSITALPTPPSTSSPTTFDSDADAFLGALPDFGTDLNAAASNVYANAVEAATSAGTATTAASTATTAATTALNAPATQATSSSSITVATGSLAFSLLQTGKAFAVGMWVLISDTAAPNTRWLAGGITAFNSGTGAITVDVAYIAGTGSATSWAVTPIAPTSSSASNLVTGTLPDGRFPATLPAVSGANLTNLDASDLSAGTIPNGRFPATLPAASAANLTSIPAGQLTGDISFPRLASLYTLNTAVPGYRVSADGFVMQWGVTTVGASSNLTVSLPIAFPNNFVQAIAIMDNTSAAVGNRVGAGIVSLAQIQLQNSTGPVSVRWMAFGN